MYMIFVLPHGETSVSIATNEQREAILDTPNFQPSDRQTYLDTLHSDFPHLDSVILFVETVDMYKCGTYPSLNLDAFYINRVDSHPELLDTIPTLSGEQL